MPNDETVIDKPKVLVIDDEAPNLSTFRRVFRADFDMTLVSSVAAGLDVARRSRFDVAVVDYAMPGEDGIVFLREATRVYPDMIRLMVTAHEGLPEVKRAYEDGFAHAILMKPWTRESILRWVTNGMRMQKLRRTVSEMRVLVDKKSDGGKPDAKK